MDWCGEPPKTCDICHGNLTNEFVDGKTVFGCAGFMCAHCHPKFGRGLGTGRGQKFVKNASGVFTKVEG